MRPNTKEPRTVQERSVVDPQTGCWNWRLCKDADGYGWVRFRNRMLYAHRFSYEVFVGPIPDGLTIDHLCRNPGCVNPEHLEAVTDRENILRGTNYIAANTRKTHCPKGHPLSGENLRLAGRNKRRVCRTCRREGARRLWATNADVRRRHAERERERQRKQRATDPEYRERTNALARARYWKRRADHQRLDRNPSIPG